MEEYIKIYINKEVEKAISGLVPLYSFLLTHSDKDSRYKEAADKVLQAIKGVSSIPQLFSRAANKVQSQAHENKSKEVATATTTQPPLQKGTLKIREKNGELMIYPTIQDDKYIITVYCEGRIKVRFINTGKDDHLRLLKLLNAKKELRIEDGMAKIDVYTGKIIRQ